MRSFCSAFCLCVGGVLLVGESLAAAEPPRVEVDTTRSEVPEAAQADETKVLQWYGQTAGRVYESLWNAVPDPDLLAKTPQEILHWVEGRLGPQCVQPATVPRGSDEAAIQADLARAYVALAQQDTADGKPTSCFDERYAVLGRVLGRMIRTGEGPLGATALQIQALAKQYPDRWEATALYVDYFRAITSIVERQALSYATLAGGTRDAAFTERVLTQAREAERQRMGRLCETFQGTKTADLAAIYAVAGYRRDLPDKRQKADQIVTQHRNAWEADRSLWDRAVVAVGCPLAAPHLARELVFVDTTGKRCAAADLRGKTTVFVFFSPLDHKAVAHFRAQVPWVQVIGVPITAVPKGSDEGMTVDPGSTDVFVLAKALGMTGIPGMVLVTPNLEVTSGPENVADYLKNHNPSKAGNDTAGP